MNKYEKMLNSYNKEYEKEEEKKLLKKFENIYLGPYYSIGYSSLHLSYYGDLLTVSFQPYEGVDKDGKHQFSKKVFQSTTINHEGAAYFYCLAARVLNGIDLDKEFEACLQCGKNATLTLHYMKDNDRKDEMCAFFVIRKNDETIPFLFRKDPYKTTKDGIEITEIIQTGLGSFAMDLRNYIRLVRAEKFLSKAAQKSLEDGFSM